MKVSAPQGPDPLVRLAGRIRGRVEHVLDVDEMSALIESMGINDRMAQQDYAAANVRALAARIQALARRSDVPAIPEDEILGTGMPDRAGNPFTAGPGKLGLGRAYHWGRHFGRLHLKGFFFALPAVISVVGLLLLNATLWVSFMDDAPLSTAIGLGTLASFVVTGGFSQAIAQRGLFYRLQREYLLARTVCYYFIRVGCAMALVVAMLGLCANTLFGILTPGHCFVALTYYVILSLLWLALAVLYMLNQPLLFVPVLTVGITIVYALHHFGLPLVAQQSAALLSVAALAFLAGYLASGQKAAWNTGLMGACLQATLAILVALHLLSGWHQQLAAGICAAMLLGFALILFTRARRQAQAEAASSPVRLPRPSLLWYKAGPYFAYGTLYYCFLFIDRLMAWSAPHRSAVPDGFLFQAHYELGMNGGLMILLCTIGLADSAIISFSERIRADEQRFTLQDPQSLCTLHKRLYATRGLLFVLLSATAGALLWFGLTTIARHSTGIAVRAYLQPIPQLVFLAATVSYALLSWSLFNNIFLFTLSRPERVLPNMVVALLVHVLVSYAVTRLYGGACACIGFLTGCLVLATLSTITVVRVIDRLDYYYYSAFL